MEKKCLQCGAATDGTFECTRVFYPRWFLFRTRVVVGYFCRPCAVAIAPRRIEEVERDEEYQHAIK